jgi:diacylglycerol kinase family enzyme
LFTSIAPIIPDVARRIFALIALVAVIAAVVLLVVAAVQAFPRGLIVLGLLAAAAFAGWHGLLRSGRTRTALWVLAGLLVLGAVVRVLVGGIQWEGVAALALIAVSLPCARRAFAVHASLSPAPPPQRAVVVWNPRSGGGKALTHHLADEARARGIEPIELRPGDDLVVLVRDAVARGADGLAAAGGDGTQALVAEIAAEHDLPFACIPAGTRNHFALDLGVDRDDVVGALDAFVAGGEKRVDLGDVGGRVFVNNVSLGLYAVAVQSAGYRDAKIRTLLDTAPNVLSSQGGGPTLRWTGPDGRPRLSAAVVLVSNNAYRLGRALGSGTRPAMDTGQLGVAVAGVGGEDGGRRLWEQWVTKELVVDSDEDVPVGIDGEALVLPAPVTCRIRPSVLRVRIAPQHPGASPSAALPPTFGGIVGALARIAAGADPLALAPTRGSAAPAR